MALTEVSGLYFLSSQLTAGFYGLFKSTKERLLNLNTMTQTNRYKSCWGSKCILCDTVQFKDRIQIKDISHDNKAIQVKTGVQRGRIFLLSVVGLSLVYCRCPQRFSGQGPLRWEMHGAGLYWMCEQSYYFWGQLVWHVPSVLVSLIFSFVRVYNADAEWLSFAR